MCKSKKIGMYPCTRRFDVNSIGVWLYDVGRPTDKSTKKWVQKCNFVFETIATVCDDGASNGCGWLIQLRLQDGEKVQCFIKSDVSSSNVCLRKKLMGVSQGLISRMTADDFLSFVDRDSTKSALPIVFLARHLGKACIDGEVYWIFPNVVLTAKGKIATNHKMFLCLDSLRKRENGDTYNLPMQLPNPQPYHASEDMFAKMTELSDAIRRAYGPRFMQIAHVLTSVLKAIHFDTLMKQEHFVPICNISGPANVGKTLGCAIALQILDSKACMMSRCTPSAMIDVAHILNNMLIVWDDPRDCNASQLSSIVHEAFNGLANCTISRGARQYNSTLIIGTQDRCLGMPYNAMNAATFSRLSHIDMCISEDWAMTSDAETQLQATMNSLEGVFSYLMAKTSYDSERVKQILDKLCRENPSIIHRSLHIAAIDYYMCTVLKKCGFTIHDKELHTYFFSHYPSLLQSCCSRFSPLEKFCADVKHLTEHYDLPSSCFKAKVLVELKDHGPTECFAVYTKEFFAFMEAHLEHMSYTKEQIHSQLKKSPQYGEVSRNVAFKCGANRVQIKRSIVVRRSFL